MEGLVWYFKNWKYSECFKLNKIKNKSLKNLYCFQITK